MRLMPAPCWYFYLFVKQASKSIQHGSIWHSWFITVLCRVPSFKEGSNFQAYPTKGKRQQLYPFKDVGPGTPTDTQILSTAPVLSSLHWTAPPGLYLSLYIYKERDGDPERGKTEWHPKPNMDTKRSLQACVSQRGTGDFEAIWCHIL